MKKILKVIAPMFLLLTACNNAKSETSTNTIGESTTFIPTETSEEPTSTVTPENNTNDTRDETSTPPSPEDNTTDTRNETSTPPSPEDNTTGTGGGTSSIDTEEKSVTVNFDNINGLTAGTNLSNSAEKLKQFKNYFTTEIGHDWVDNIECTGPIVINEYGNSGNRTLCIGSGSSGGTIDFHFDNEKTEDLSALVEIDAQIYNKYDSYNKVWRIDSEAKLNVNGTEVGFDTPSGSSEPNHKTISTYVLGRNLNLKTDSANSRVLIHAITFYYYE